MKPWGGLNGLSQIDCVNIMRQWYPQYIQPIILKEEEMAEKKFVLPSCQTWFHYNRSGVGISRGVNIVDKEKNQKQKRMKRSLLPICVMKDVSKYHCSVN